MKLGVGLHYCCTNLSGNHRYSTVLIACRISIYILSLPAAEEHKQAIPCWRTRHAAIPSRCDTGGQPGRQGNVAYRQIPAVQGPFAIFATIANWVMGFPVSVP